MKFPAWLLIFVACGGSSDAPVCGDGVVDPLEQCDDGNNVQSDGCDLCKTTVPPVCGDDVTDLGEDCDDGNLMNNDGCSATCTVEAQLTMTWSFKNLATNQPTACPAGFDTVRVVTQEVDATFNNVGTPVIDLHPCAGGTGTGTFPPALYKTFLEVTNTAGTQVYAQSATSYIVDLAMFEPTLPVTIVTDGGYFGLSWQLRGATSNNVLTCAQASASSVSLVATVTSSTTATEDLFPCTQGGGLTAAILAGSYTVSLGALNAAEQAVGTAPTLVNRVIEAPNKITNLGTVTIPITGL